MNGKKIGGWMVCDGFAAVMNVRQTYTVKHIRKGLTLLSFRVRRGKAGVRAREQWRVLWIICL